MLKAGEDEHRDAEEDAHHRLLFPIDPDRHVHEHAAEEAPQQGLQGQLPEALFAGGKRGLPQGGHGPKDQKPRQQGAQKIAQQADVGGGEGGLAAVLCQEAHLAGVEVEAEPADGEQSDAEEQSAGIAIVAGEEHGPADGDQKACENAVNEIPSQHSSIFSSPRTISPMT